MKKITAGILVLLIGTALYYAVIHDWSLPSPTFDVPLEQSDKSDAVGPKVVNKPVHPHHHDDSCPSGPEDTHAAEEEDREYGNQDQDHYSYSGADIGREEFIIMLDESRRERGAEPVHRPYWSRLKELHQMVEARGYKREELFDIYRSSVWTIAAPAFAGIELPPDERKRFQRSLEESKTMRLVQLFENQDREAIEQWIKDRRSENEHDIPAIYANLILNFSIINIDDNLDTVEEMIVALDHFVPSHIPKEAVLYETLAAAMVWGSLTETGIESRKVRGGSDKISSLPHWLLFAMELAGDW